MHSPWTRAALQKCAATSTPQNRGGLMLAKGVPSVVALILLMPVTYRLSNRLLPYSATLHGISGEDQPTRRSVRFCAVPRRKAGVTRQLPCTTESELQRYFPR